jgi:hypothetical protein
MPSFAIGTRIFPRAASPVGVALRVAHNETSMRPQAAGESENAKRRTVPRYQRICGTSEEIGFI